MKVECRKLDSRDLEFLKRLVALYEEVFEMENFEMPGDGHLRNLLADERVIFYVAVSENEEVIGGLTAHVLPSTYSPATEIYVYDLAVKTESQRKGIGTRLMNSLGKYGAAMGAREVYVQADSEDRHALDFYRAINGRAASVVHFSYSLAADDGDR